MVAGKSAVVGLDVGERECKEAALDSPEGGKEG